MIARLFAHPWLYGVAGAAILGAVAWAVHDVRSAYRARAALPIARAERDAAILARDALSEAVDRQVEANGRLDRETAKRLKAADDFARSLAERLRIVSAARRQLCPAPAAASVDHGAVRESGDSEAIRRGFERVDRATEAHLAASGRDAERLTGAQTYIKGLPKRCVPD